MGAELGFADAVSTNGRWQSFVASLRPAHLEADAGGEMDTNESSHFEYIFDRTLPIAGMCHILDNLGKDLHRYTAALGVECVVTYNGSGLDPFALVINCFLDVLKKFRTGN